MTAVTARVPTANGAKYVTQLCKHWGHRLQVDLADGRGVVRFGSTVATMEAGADAILIRLEVEDPAEVEPMKAAIERHLDRFAFREAPLTYDWS